MNLASHAVVWNLLDGLDAADWDHLPNETQIYVLSFLWQRLVNGALTIGLPRLLENLSSVDLLKVGLLLGLMVE